jgi:hypothetical protein
MKRHFPGLHAASKNGQDLLGGVFLVRVSQVSYHWHREKPFLALHFSILEPKEYLNETLSGRLYCTSKALWKLNWFLRDFGYDHELFTRDEVDEKALRGLRGVIQTSRTTCNGRSFLNLDAFASAGDWEEFRSAAVGSSENSHGL